MEWTQTEWNLRDALAGLYPTIPLSLQVLERAKVPSGRIEFTAARLTNWFLILTEADKHKKVDDIVRVASEEFPEQEALKLYLEKGELAGVKGADIEEEVDWQAPTDSDTLEKIIGRQSTLLPISFLEVGLEKARSVARIVRNDGTLGTGFLTSDNLLITNHHVLGDESDAQNAVAQFNYQLTPAGLAVASKELKFDPSGDGFATLKADDWTAVRVEGNPNEKWGALPLEEIDLQKGDRVNIIQHPMGEHKQIALYHNVVVYVGHDRIQYLTDTMPGSSGSPVFNGDWQLVALHHSGGNLIEPGTKQVYYRNEGIHINAVIKGMKAAGLVA
jgi:V8-like Glu-specific endopeptidase